ncbi:MAG: DUF2709 domain-containing protein [Parachlamydiaceae bacterium]|nr:DUF2709 domain-containing protein [Parachlamydiaceae bacterium]
MTKLVITEDLKSSLESYLKKNSSAELLNAYLFFIEQRYNIQPVLFSKDKMIYQSADDAIRLLEQEDKIWHETEIKIGFGNLNVNEQSKKIYICPFSGKVFADNTHPNPQDAIYDWVSRCPENTERVGGLRVKRFYISEDPEVMKSYIAKVKHKAPITKKVFSSVLSGKLFGSKEGVLKDFKQNYLHPMSLAEVQNQNKYQIEEHFLAFIQKHLNEEKVGDFVEALLRIEEFIPYVEKWME